MLLEKRCHQGDKSIAGEKRRFYTIREAAAFKRIYSHICIWEKDSIREFLSTRAEWQQWKHIPGRIPRGNMEMWIFLFKSRILGSDSFLTFITFLMWPWKREKQGITKPQKNMQNMWNDAAISLANDLQPTHTAIPSYYLGNHFLPWILRTMNVIWSKSSFILNRTL